MLSNFQLIRESIGVFAVRSRLQTAGRGPFASAAAAYTAAQLQYPALVCVVQAYEAVPLSRLLL